MAVLKELYDVVVIGGGTAGSNAARSALQAGARNVLLIHQPTLLNTCAEEGCMPSKSIIHASHEGLSFGEATERMEGHIERLKNGLQETLTQEFEMLVGDASFEQDGSLRVVTDSDTLVVCGKRFVIASGSSTFVPPIAGLEDIADDFILTSEDIVSKRHIKELPRSVFIVGGGPIGLEMLTIFANFGVAVTIAERGTLLGRMDPEFGVEMEKALMGRGDVRLLTNTTIERVAQKGAELSLTTTTDGVEHEYQAEKLFFATGRIPNLQTLGVEKVGLELEKGKVTFNAETLQTSNPDIFVAGDVTGTYQILHYAGAMGRVAGYNAARGAGEKTMNYPTLSMGVIFSEPQIGNVGLTESVAKEKGIEVVSATLDLPTIGRGLLENRKIGLWKLTAEKGTGLVVGAQAIGPSPHSEWFVDTVAWIMHFKGTVHDLKTKQPYYHPTYPELFQSLGRELCRKLDQEVDDSIRPN